METDQNFSNDPGPSAPDPSPPAFTSSPSFGSQQFPSDSRPFPGDPDWPRTRRSAMSVSGPVGIAAAVIGIVVFLIVAAAIVSRGRDVSTPGFNDPGGISWVVNGDTITAGDYRAVESSATEQSVRRQFGRPADMTGGKGCIGYRASVGSSLYIFCFDENGRFVSKQTF